MPNNSPLNPGLYDALLHVFHHVEISNPGATFAASPVPLFKSRRFGLTTVRHNLNIVDWGETYRINCPFCGDTRQRMWICHRWGEFDQWTRGRNLFLAHCFNEECQVEKAWELYQMVQSAPAAAAITAPTTVAAEPTATVPITLPIDYERLESLPKDHAAVLYVRSRGFDPVKLSQRWGVGFSMSAVRASRHGRLLIPIYDDKGPEAELIGWQARAIAPGDTPKYFTAKGMKKSRTLYGLQRLDRAGPIVIMEGVTDVWRFGKNGVALFGKKASPAQIDMIRKNFQGRELVIMLDADAEDDADLIVERISRARRSSLLRNDPARVVAARLPSGLDPGDCTRADLKEIVRRALAPAKRK